MLNNEIRSLSDPVRVKNSAWYFKTGPGQYGEGDKFLGITTPQMRVLSHKYRDLPLPENAALITSKYHEERSVAVQILVSQYPKCPKEIFDFYLAHTKYINNWDLVDISAPKIVGDYEFSHPSDLLAKLAHSPGLWERRIAIISTLYFLIHGKNQPTFEISKILLNDKQDLIHKAVGWMLRESAKRIDQQAVEDFLKENYSRLPRTTLRYAIERFPEKKRKQYLSGNLKPPSILTASTPRIGEQNPVYLRANEMRLAIPFNSVYVIYIYPCCHSSEPLFVYLKRLNYLRLFNINQHAVFFILE